MATFNINTAGFGIAALFVIVWALALAYWKIGKVENTWATASPSRPAQVQGGQQTATIAPAADPGTPATS
jgi:hypothetical protein